MKISFDLSWETIRRSFRRLVDLPYYIRAYIEQRKLHHMEKFYVKWYKIWTTQLEEKIVHGVIPADLLSVRFKPVISFLGPPFLQIAVQTTGEKEKKTIAILSKDKILLYVIPFLNHILTKRNMYITNKQLLVFYDVNTLNVSKVKAITCDRSNAQLIFKTELGDIRLTLTPYRDMITFLFEELTTILLEEYPNTTDLI